MDRKHSKVSKTVWMVSVSITELIWQAKPWDIFWQEVDTWCVVLTLNLSHWKTQGFRNILALPIASTRCRQSFHSGLSLIQSKLSEWDILEIGHRGWAITIMTPAAMSTPTFGNGFKGNEIIPLESYWLSWCYRPWRLMFYNVWHVWTNGNIFFPLVHDEKSGWLTSCANETEIFGHKWWAFLNKTTFVMDLWYLEVTSDEENQR